MEAAWGKGKGVRQIQGQQVLLMHQTVQQETEQGCQRLVFHRLKPNVYKANRSSQTTMLRAQAELAQISEMLQQHASLAGPPPHCRGDGRH